MRSTVAALVIAAVAGGGAAAHSGGTQEAGPSSSSAPDQAANEVRVTVKYSGKGMVDANHKIWIPGPKGAIAMTFADAQRMQ